MCEDEEALLQEVRADGTFFVETEYLKGGKWTPGREAHYKEAAGMTVKFR